LGANAASPLRAIVATTPSGVVASHHSRAERCKNKDQGSTESLLRIVTTYFHIFISREMFVTPQAAFFEVAELRFAQSTGFSLCGFAACKNDKRQ
jgi:hypothetical protein